MEVNSLHPGDPINDQHSDVVTGFSSFNNNELNYSLAGTYRFGELTPHFVFDGLTGDRCSVRSSHDVRSLNMKSPLMGQISLKKDYFNVPMESILPLNWDKIFTNPLIGEDVPEDAYCCIDTLNFFTSWRNYFSQLCRSSEASYGDGYLSTLMDTICCADMIFGNGALPAALGANLHRCVTFASASERISFTKFFDRFWQLFSNTSFTLSTYNIADEVVDTYQINSPGHPGLHRAIEIIKDNPYCKMTFALNASQRAALSSAINLLLNGHFTPEVHPISERTFDLKRFYAYQIVCAHFYTNDKIDYVYSANLYRQYMHHLCDNLGVGVGSFLMNGLDLTYDVLSGNSIPSDFLTLDDADSHNLRSYFFISSIFGYRQSLRFVDYFTGARSQPLAVGDTGVAVSGNQIDVVDVTRKIQVQRYLNAVNRAGRKFSDYIKGIFGVTPAYDYHDPKFLSHTADSIFGVETQNTGDAQMSDANSTTSNLRTNASRYAFEYELDRPGVVIGIQYFDLPRYYSSTIDRSYFHKDRYDMFNPQMQFIGDQKLLLSEYDPAVASSEGQAFGYQSRYMEYKQRYNTAFGGFLEDLPSWIFIDRPAKYGTNSLHISPRFIRSTCEEMDQFFTSLTGYSNGSYFHFIIITDNDMNGTKRAMVRDPKLL